MTKLLIISFLILTFATQGQSQDSLRHVVAKAQLYGDSVVLRWAPTNALQWERGNKYGYQIERVTLDPKRNLLPEGTTKLTTAPVLPYTLDQWRQSYAHTDTLAGVAVSLLYAKTSALAKGNQLNLADGIDQHYQRENRFTYSLLLAEWYPRLGKGLGLRKVDKPIDRTKSYLYRVILNGDGKRIKPDTALALVMAGNVYKPAEFMPVVLRTGERAVQVAWNRVIAGDQFSAYWVERSDDGGKTYRRLNRQPYVQPTEANINDPRAEITYTDSIPKTYRPYRYRVQGITSFGDLSLYSKVLVAVGRDQTAPSAPTSVTVINIGTNRVRIDWKKTVREPDLAGYVVGKSSQMNGPFTPLHERMLPAGSLSFTDPKADPNQPTYYLVAAIDTAGNAGRAPAVLGIIYDNVAPAFPTRLKGAISKTGVMTVSWRAGSETDLLGYIVYYANAPDHRFVPLTKGILTDTVFVDSVMVKTLTRNAYVKVAALDRHENVSVFSEVLAIERPDIVPPTAPVFNKFSVSDSTVSMSWNSSQNTDLTQQMLYRRTVGSSDTTQNWQLVATLHPDVSSYVDRKIARQHIYEYSLVSRDAAGLRSPYSFPLRIRTYDSGYKLAISNFSIQLAADNRSIDITYQYALPGVSSFALYRSFGSSGLQLLTTIPAKQYRFSDRTARYKGDYEYALKALFTDGTESPMTARKKIKLD